MKMKQTDRMENLLNWLDKEKIRDKRDLEKNKNDFIKEIKKIKKEDIFISKKEEQKPFTLWQKIRKMIWGL